MILYYYSHSPGQEDFIKYYLLVASITRRFEKSHHTEGGFIKPKNLPGLNVSHIYYLTSRGIDYTRFNLLLIL